jgi:hypothetical protein
MKDNIRIGICVFACATIEKYKLEILKINETWRKQLDDTCKIQFFLGEEQTDLEGPEYIYLKGIDNSYESAALKQNLGIKYMYNYYDFDFLFVCGSDTYINIPNLFNLLKNHTRDENVYIGGHGDTRIIEDVNYYFHSGGPGFILTNSSVKMIYNELETMHLNWKQICKDETLYPACDVAIAYYLTQKNVRIIKYNTFYACNYKGFSKNSPCCVEKINPQEIVSCHSMSLEDFDSYYSMKSSTSNQIKPIRCNVPDSTLVSACFCLHDISKQTRTLEEILFATDYLMKLPCYLVMYGDKKTIPILRKKRQEYQLLHLTQFIELELSDIWSFQYLEKVNQNREKYWPTKDHRTSSESHLICCNKFDFVLQTIYTNPFKTSKFAWIDSFLTTKDTECRFSEEYKPNTIPNILNSINDKFSICILNATDKKYKLPEHKKEYYNEYRWVVCGGFFTCGKEIGIKILTRLKEIFVQTTEMGYGHGEEMFYLEVLDEFYDDIDRKYSDYGQTLDNFIIPKRNIHYIVHSILYNFLSLSYHKEIIHCAETLLREIENHKIDVSPDLYFFILFKYYISSYYYQPNKAKEIVRHIYNIFEIYPNVKKVFLEMEGFYKEQFNYVQYLQ